MALGSVNALSVAGVALSGKDHVCSLGLVLLDLALLCWIMTWWLFGVECFTSFG